MVGLEHYSDIILTAMASQITSLTIVYPSVYSSADQRKYQSSASLAFVREIHRWPALAFVRGIHRWPMNFWHKGPVTRKMFPFDDVIMNASFAFSVKYLRNYHIIPAVWIFFRSVIPQTRARVSTDILYFLYLSVIINDSYFMFAAYKWIRFSD